MPRCIICGKEFKNITHTHLKKFHSIESVAEYYMKYPQAQRNPSRKGISIKRKAKKEYSTPELRATIQKDPLEQALYAQWGL